jgi:hypothetical protein
VTNAIARNPFVVGAKDAKANPNIAILIEKRPNYTKLRLLNLVRSFPTIGEHIMTATEYILKVER